MDYDIRMYLKIRHAMNSIDFILNGNPVPSSDSGVRPSELTKANAAGLKTWSEVPDLKQGTGFASTEPPSTNTLVPRDAPLPDLNADVHHFLSLPVKIYTDDWDVGGIPSDFSPWNLYFANAAVKRKLANFYLISGTLRLKIVSNGSAFQYGCLSWGYLPNPVDVYRNQTNGLIGYAIQNLPFRFYTDGASNQEVNVDLPWVWGSEDIIPSTTLSSGGQFLCLEEAPLLSASAGPLDPQVTISVYASLINPKIQFRTGAVASGKAKDYKGILSKPLSLVAATAERFSSAPMIGKYATTASMLSSGAADLATLFGYSAPNRLEQPNICVEKTVSSLASTVNVDGGTVLATDPRAETAIDPSLNGLLPMDEMVISEIAQRFSLVAKKAWTLGATGDVFSISTTPFYTDQTFPCSFSHVAYATFPFRYYRGTLRYRFRIPCCQVHTGRVQFTFDPFLDITGADPTNVKMNVVYDLQHDKEIILEIPYTSGSLVKASFPKLATTVAGYISNTTIGTITCRVITPLKAAGVSASVSILVDVAAGPDWEVFVPTWSDFNTATTRLSFVEAAAATAAPADTAITGYTISGILAEPSIEEVRVDEPDSAPPSDPFPLLVASERVVSFRSLVKRFGTYGVVSLPVKGASSVVGRLVHELPYNPGYALNTSSANIYTNVHQWNILNYLMPAYYGYRGGTRHKFVDLSNVESACIFVSRFERAGTINEIFAYSTQNSEAYRSLGDAAELVATTKYNMKAAEVTIPWRNPTLIVPTQSSVSPYQARRALLLGYSGNSTAAPTLLHLGAGADDFSLFLYTGSPVFFSNTVA